jgi:multidrug efflux pump subunit AcrB
MKRILTAFARNTVFANIAIIMILISGALAIKFMQRELFPDFSMGEISIVVPYPGASPSEVEEGIIRYIEEALEGMEGVAEYTTKSDENQGSAAISVKSGYHVSNVMDRIRNNIGAISTFPQGAEKPMITEVMHRSEVMKIYLAGALTEHELKDLAFQIKDGLRLLPGVSQINLTGIRDYEIDIEIPEERLRAYGLSFDDVSKSIAASNLNLSCGVIRTDQKEVRIRSIGRKYTADELSSIVVLTEPDGSMVTLDQIAEIKDTFTDDTNEISVNGQDAVVFGIFKTRREDAFDISVKVNAFVENKQSQLPEGTRIGILYDSTDYLRSRIDLLVKNGIMGMCLVLLLLWMFLDLKLSFWAGIGIPVSILGALAVVWAMGGTINMLSLFGLITVLGIVVDDAIIVGEAIFHHRQKGLSPLDAAVEGVQEVGIPVAAAILTTAIAFLPFLFIADVIGKFISILPMIVIPCLIVSLIECIFLLPTHLIHGLKCKTEHNRILQIMPFRKLAAFQHYTRCSIDKFADRVYLPILKEMLKMRYISLCTTICVLFISLGFILGGIVKFEALPDAEGYLISSSIKFPAGTSSNVTRKAVEKVESALLNISKDIELKKDESFLKNRMVSVGSTLAEDDDAETGHHVGGILAIVSTSENRSLKINEILNLWEQAVGDIPGAKSILYEGMSEGPPGDPIEVRLRGHNLDKLKKAASEFTAELHKINGVHQIQSDGFSGIDEIHFSLKPEARLLGLTQENMAQQIRAAFYGQEAVRLQRGRDDVRVKVHYTNAERKDLSTLKNIRLSTDNGHKVPLLSVADVTFSKGYESINRVDGMRCLNINAAVDMDKADPNEIIEDLSNGFLIELSEKYPGLDISFQGDEKHMHDAIGGLFIGFPMAILGIFIIVASTFRSYAHPFIILFTVPFGIIGGIFGHLLMGYDLSLMSIFGMVALSGIVVNDAIVLIERINENLAQGTPFFQAIQNAGRRRFRAIVLTTISTVGGLAPLILETSLQAQFLIPMALSISAGLIFATILTLIQIPCLFVVLNDLRLLSNRLFTGEWAKKREALEPAIKRYLQTDTNGPESSGYENARHAIKS